MDQSTSDLFPDRNASASLSARLSPLLPAWAIPMHREDGLHALSRLKSLLSCAHELWPSLIECDVTDHRNHFDLAVDRNLFVHFALGIKPREFCAIQDSNGSEMSTRNVILLRKIKYSGKGFVSLTEDNRIFSRLFSMGQDLNRRIRGSPDTASRQLCPVERHPTARRIHLPSCANAPSWRRSQTMPMRNPVALVGS